MSALAVRTGSINLGQGFPDTDGPIEVLAAAVRAIQEGRGNQYPPGPGIPELRQAISSHQRAWYGLSFDPDDEVLVTVGATEAIASAVLGLTAPGDEVVTFEPYYDSYAACIALAGAQRRVVTLRPERGHQARSRGSDELPARGSSEGPWHRVDRIEDRRARWSFDPDELRRAVTPRTRLILLNSPHNPTGTVFNLEELQFVASVAIEHDLIVITDEVYEHLVFDGEHLPLATLPGMAERTVTVSSAGKTFSVTGWKVGWACAPATLLAPIRAVKQFLTYVGSGPFQYAIAEALAAPREYYRDLAADLRTKRDLLTSGLHDLGLTVLVPQATYFATVDVRSHAREWCLALPELAGVVAIPMRVFYDSEVDRYVRFAFCKKTEVLSEALTRMAAVRGAATSSGADRSVEQGAESVGASCAPIHIHTDPS